jgi:hypothetical protein
MSHRAACWLIFLACASFASGCATVSSQRVGRGVTFDTSSNGVSDPGAVPSCAALPPEQRARVTCREGGDRALSDSAGITYFLPRQLARVTATRTDLHLDELIKALVKAQGELEQAQAAVDAANAAIHQTEDAIIAGAGGAAAQPVLAARLSAQRADLATATAALPTKQQALDQAKTDLRNAVPAPGATPTAPHTPPATPAHPTYKVTLKIELLSPSADPAQAYRLSPLHTPFRDDEHTLVISPAGLLTSTNTVAVDRTADILVEIGTFAGAIASGVPIPGPTGRDGRTRPANQRPEDLCTLSPNEFTGVVDFADPAAVRQLNRNLQCLGVRTQVTGQVWEDTGPAPASDMRIEGIVYRTPVEVQVRIERCVRTDGGCNPNGPYWVPTEVIALALPQAGPISFVRQDAGFMTRSRYTLAFKDGMITNYDSSRPSELLEVARTPLRIVQGVFDGVSRVISLRTGQNNALASLSASQLAAYNGHIALQAGQINSQATLISARIAALNAEFALRAAQLAGDTGLTNAQTTALNAEYALRLAEINGQTSLQAGQIGQQTTLNNAQLALLQSQAALASGANNGAAQVSASNLSLTVALLRDQARREALNRCIAQQVSLGASIETCLVGF